MNQKNLLHDLPTSCEVDLSERDVSAGCNTDDIRPLFVAHFEPSADLQTSSLNFQKSAVEAKQTHTTKYDQHINFDH